MLLNWLFLSLAHIIVGLFIFFWLVGLVAKLSPTLATLWTVAPQVPLSMGFPRQENWNGCHSLLQRIFLTHGANLCLLHWQWGNEPQGKPYSCIKELCRDVCHLHCILSSYLYFSIVYDSFNFRDLKFYIITMSFSMAFGFPVLVKNFFLF